MLELFGFHVHWPKLKYMHVAWRKTGLSIYKPENELQHGKHGGWKGAKQTPH